MRETAYIGLGSNLDTPAQQLEQAIRAIAALPDTRVDAVSSFYCSKPMGPQDQPDFVNAVAKISTGLTPISLLDGLQAIELQQGRVRKKEQWGPRTLDLDILLFGRHQINSERLTVPHYGIKTREFVLVPLAEIEPTLTMPDGDKIDTMLHSCELNGLYVLKH